MKKALFVITIMIVSLCATMALADSKIYPGSMAVRWNSSEPVPALYYSSIENSSAAQSLEVDLPIIHDGQAVHRINSAWVRVSDRHPAQNVCAQLISVYLNGNCGFVASSSPRKCSSGVGCPYLKVGALPTVNNAHYYIAASIPQTFNGARSSIISYMVDEAE